MSPASNAPFDLTKIETAVQCRCNDTNKSSGDGTPINKQIICRFECQKLLDLIDQHFERHAVKHITKLHQYDAEVEDDNTKKTTESNIKHCLAACKAVIDARNTTRSKVMSLYLQHKGKDSQNRAVSDLEGLVAWYWHDGIRDIVRTKLRI